MERIFIDAILGAVTLRESSRAQNVSIKVQRRDGAITLVIPIGYPAKSAIAFMESKRERIIAIRERYAAQRQTSPPAVMYDVEELRAKARQYLPQRIAELSAQTNLQYNKVSLRATRSKWGSCSGENNISLSVYLMILPPHLIDFVILHELCHTVHHNHSPKFHALLNYITNGHEKALNRELKSYSIR